MHYLALCCIARDEDPFLKEWLAYHALLGVEHFYVFDNMSATPIAERLDGFIDPSRVTIRRVEGKALQKAVYQHCLEEFGPSCVWLGFIDIDEFICPLEDNDLRVFLTEFEPCAGLGISWDMFSSAGHIRRPEGPVIKNYTRRLTAGTDAIHGKSIVRPAKTASNYTPHAFRYKAGEICVTEDHLPVPVDTPFFFSRRRRIKINHYFYRSRQDFEEKIRRGRADVGDAIPRALAQFDAHLDKPAQEDTAILRFLPAVEKALRKDRLPASPNTLSHGEPYHKYMEAALAFADAGQVEKAALCLTRAVPLWEDLSDLWTVRAVLARAAKRYERAERFLLQALRYEESPNAYLELIALRTAEGRLEEARALQEFLRALMLVKGQDGK